MSTNQIRVNEVNRSTDTYQRNKELELTINKFIAHSKILKLILEEYTERGGTLNA